MNAATWVEGLRTGQGLSRWIAGRGAQALVAALVIALALDCALILTRLMSQSSTVAATPVSSALMPAPRAVNPTLQLATIVNAHLFGTGALSGGADAPTTSMPLILAGVIAERDPSQGQAIIGQNAAAAKLYAVGAMIPGGAKLHAVYDNRVLLERNGALEALMLPRTPMAGAVPTGAAQLPDTQLNASAIRDNSSLLAGLVRIQPVFTQGKLTGYRIFPGGTRGASAFRQLGLHAGDLILAINGSTLDDPSRAMEALQTLSSAGSATVTVSHNGQPQEVNLNLATVASEVDAAQGADQSGSAGGSAPPQDAPTHNRPVGFGPPGATSGAAPGNAPGDNGNSAASGDASR